MRTGGEDDGGDDDGDDNDDDNDDGGNDDGGPHCPHYLLPEVLVVLVLLPQDVFHHALLFLVPIRVLGELRLDGVELDLGEWQGFITIMASGQGFITIMASGQRFITIMTR